MSFNQEQDARHYLGSYWLACQYGRHLVRVRPAYPLPPGCVRVTAIRSFARYARTPVADSAGILLPQFWSLRRLDTKGEVI